MFRSTARPRKDWPSVVLELVMQVSRDDDNRLSGTVRLGRGSQLHSFSGTLELMRAFEELVPLVPDAAVAKPTRSSETVLPNRARPGHPTRRPRSSEGAGS
jgi:hypothetical protein